jgi:D-alanine transaminase
MSRTAYVNGRYQPMADAMVHVEDRGYQFADGVYEVCEVNAGRLVDERRHMERLQRSLRELRIDMPMTPAALGVVMRETVRRNQVSYGIVYLQITRGVARRDHAFPTQPVRPAIVITAKSQNVVRNAEQAAKGIAVVTTPENRWPRVDIKSVSLLPNVLAKQQAREAGAYEAWYVDGKGFVTEGSSSNAWIVTKDGKIITRPVDHGILSGITRAVVMEEIANLQLQLEERAFTAEEAAAAAEAFVTAATQIVMPVVKIDGKAIGDGKPGAVAKRLREQFHRFAEFSL